MADNEVRNIKDYTVKELLLLVYDRQCHTTKCQEETVEHLKKLNGSVSDNTSKINIIEERQKNVCQRVWRDIPNWIKLPIVIWVGVSVFIMALGIDKLI